VCHFVGIANVKAVISAEFRKEVKVWKLDAKSEKWVEMGRSKER